MTTTTNKETLGFQTEVKQMLHLMIHSLYSNKEIFLRELISNASDAADKLRFNALADETLYEGDSELKINLSFDKEKRTLTISDNGIGMSREEVQDNIGTIARSGTSKFFNALTGDEAKDSELIGQFGVGFYASFIVADKVTLVTRKAGADKGEAVLWESTGEGEYTIETTEKEGRGTAITLHLKEGEDEFLNSYRLKSIVKKFSDHISLPILMKKDEVPSTVEEGEKASDEAAEEFETVNSASALWTKSKDEIEPEAYNEFYKHVSHDYEEPLAYVHSRVEGSNEYTLLLYVPKKAPFDMWDRETKHGVKLYVRKVFIMDDAEELMPRYLRFVKGIIDSNSLSLNVSREILQQSKQVSKIRAGAVKKVLGLLEGLAKNDAEKYEGFWKEFGSVLKEGPIEDFKNKERIAKLLRFASTNTNTDKENVSLEDYIGRMKEGQKKIYFITADSFAAAKNSPHLEIFRKKGIEVLLLSNRVDEWLVSHLTEFDGKQLQSVAKGELDLGDLDSEEDKKEQEKSNEDHKQFVERIAATLGDKVSTVRVTNRLTASPACLVSEGHDMGLNMERIMKAAGQEMPTSKPVFEVNPEHPLVLKLQGESEGDRFNDLVEVLFDQALLSEGGQLEDPATFVHKLNELLLNVMK
jgi:molecular chaperone HtpG